jgi:hypothetical protein
VVPPQLQAKSSVSTADCSRCQAILSNTILHLISPRGRGSVLELPLEAVVEAVVEAVKDTTMSSVAEAGALV